MIQDYTAELIRGYGALTGRMLRIMDENGVVQEPDLVPALQDEQWLELYKVMMLTRAADDKALQLQRQGRMLTYAPNTGQEAAQVGPAAAMGKNDWLVPAFRELGAWLHRGIDLKSVYLYWYGNEFGSRFPEGVKVLPIAVPIGTQLHPRWALPWLPTSKEKMMSPLPTSATEEPQPVISARL